MTERISLPGAGVEGVVSPSCRAQQSLADERKEEEDSIGKKGAESQSRCSRKKRKPQKSRSNDCPCGKAPGPLGAPSSVRKGRSVASSSDKAEGSAGRGPSLAVALVPVTPPPNNWQVLCKTQSPGKPEAARDGCTAGSARASRCRNFHPPALPLELAPPPATRVGVRLRSKPEADFHTFTSWLHSSSHPFAEL